MSTKPPYRSARRPRLLSRAIIVARVSSEGQAENTSHESQIRACEMFCQKCGWEVVKCFEEVESGTLYLSRVETQAAIELIESNQADVLVLYDMSRYGRDVEYQQKILKRIVRVGGQLQFATFPLDYESSGQLTPESEQIFNFMGGASAVEGRMIKRRTQKGKREKIDAGVQICRTHSPIGWKIVDNKAVIRGEYPADKVGLYFPVREQLEMVKERIFHAYRDGASLADICVDLNENGIATPGGGKMWRPSTVRHILQGPIYTGKPVYGRTETTIDESRLELGFDKKVSRRIEKDDWQYLKNPQVDAHYSSSEIAPFLVSEEDWLICQENLATNRERKSGQPARRHPLAGMLKCHICNRACTARPDKLERLRIYLCTANSSRALSPQVERCPSPSWNAGRIEQIVYKALVSLYREPDLVSDAVREMEQRTKVAQPKQSDRASIQAQIKELEKREVAVAESKIEAIIGGTSPEPFDKLLKRYTVEKQQLQQKIQNFKVEEKQPVLFDVPEGTADTLEEVLFSSETTGQEKNNLLLKLIGTIKVFPSSVKGAHANAPERVEISLKGGREADIVLIADHFVGWSGQKKKGVEASLKARIEIRNYDFYSKQVR